MQATWILVANASEARLYQNNKRFGELQLLESFDHPASRTKGADLATDRPGHYQSKGTGHGAFVEQSTPKEQEVARFARQLTATLDSGRTARKFSRLVLVASPQFLGALNAQMSAQLRKLVWANIQKDYTKMAEHQLLPVLKEQDAL